MDVEDFVAISFRNTVVPRGREAPGIRLELFLDDLMGELTLEGCKAVGHVKGMMAGADDVPLFFSITSLENNCRFDGGPLAEGAPFSLTMNVIVAGVDKSKLNETLLVALNRHFEVAPHPDA